MLPSIVYHSYSRPTRDIYTNFPGCFSNIYQYSHRKLGKLSILPPILPDIHKKSKKIQSIDEKRIQKDIEKNKIKRERIQKVKTAEMLWNNFDIYIQPKDLNNKSIEDIMETAYYIYKYRNLNNCAYKIQKAWKNCCLHKAKKIVLVLREKAARVIQAAWKRYKADVLHPRVLRIIHEKAAVIIQKIFRGYRSRMKYYVLKGRIKIKENMKFFDDVRHQMLNDSAIVIGRYWKKYKKNLASKNNTQKIPLKSKGISKKLISKDNFINK